MYSRDPCVPVTSLIPHQNIIDRDMYQLHKKPNKAHNTKTDQDCFCDAGEFFAVGLGTFLHQMDGVLRELSQGFDQKLVKSIFLVHCVCVCVVSR